MNDQEIDEVEKQLEEEQKKAAEQEAQAQQALGGGPEGAPGAMPGGGVTQEGPSPSPPV